MPHLEINSRYQPLIDRLGLRASEDFLALPAVILSGHPDRNVAKVVLQLDDSVVHAFLKREHRIRWKERILNALAGFGFVCKSRRECLMLKAFAAAGIGCPEWIAEGEDQNGRAFLLVRELEEVSDLRLHLRERLATHPRARRRFALRLGSALARLHQAGFDHPDLYAKHILVDRDGQGIHFLDLQRSRRRQRVPWGQRWTDLAALEATLAKDLLPTADRMAGLRAYLRTCRVHEVAHGTNSLHSAFRIFRKAARLLGQRRIQEIRRGPRPEVVQRLIWLDGEALCVTPEFQAMLNRSLPDWLMLASLPERPREVELRQRVSLASCRHASLIRRRRPRLFAGLWSWVCRRRFASRELQQAAILFRLERAGVRTPKLLAFGQRQVRPWCVESFLLVEEIEAVGLDRWFAAHGHLTENRTDLAERRRLIKEAGRVLQRLHEARCHLGAASGDILQVCAGRRSDTAGPTAQEPCRRPTIVLGPIDHVYSRHGASQRMEQRDLRNVMLHLPNVIASRTDEIRFLLAYAGKKHLDAAAKRLARSFVRVYRDQRASLLQRWLGTAPAKLPLTERSTAA